MGVRRSCRTVNHAGSSSVYAARVQVELWVTARPELAQGWLLLWVAELSLVGSFLGPWVPLPSDGCWTLPSKTLGLSGQRGSCLLRGVSGESSLSGTQRTSLGRADHGALLVCSSRAPRARVVLGVCLWVSASSAGLSTQEGLGD